MSLQTKQKEILHGDDSRGDEHLEQCFGNLSKTLTDLFVVDFGTCPQKRL
jgi:hypothetical protein